MKFELLNTFFCKKMSSNLVQVPFKARCTISLFHLNETMVDKKWHCILSAYSQFVITCWDFNDNYIWKFSLLLYLRIVHIYIMLNKKFNLFCLSLSYPITYTIYLFRYFHSLFFFRMSVPNGLHNVKFC